MAGAEEIGSIVKRVFAEIVDRSRNRGQPAEKAKRIAGGSGTMGKRFQERPQCVQGGL